MNGITAAQGQVSTHNHLVITAVIGGVQIKNRTTARAHVQGIFEGVRAGSTNNAGSDGAAAGCDHSSRNHTVPTQSLTS